MKTEAACDDDDDDDVMMPGRLDYNSTWHHIPKDLHFKIRLSYPLWFSTSL
jgi:hypothetical protein